MGKISQEISTKNFLRKESESSKISENLKTSKRYVLDIKRKKLERSKNSTRTEQNQQPIKKLNYTANIQKSTARDRINDSSFVDSVSGNKQDYTKSGMKPYYSISKV